MTQRGDLGIISKCSMGTIGGEQTGQETEKQDRDNYFMEGIEHGKNLVRERTGYAPCDERWLQVVHEEDIDGDRAASIIIEDKCVNLASGIISLTHNENPRIRGRAARMVGDLKIPEAVPILIPLVKDMDEGVAKEALKTLCYLDSHACKVQLVPILAGTGPPGLQKVAPKLAALVGFDIEPKEWRMMLLGDEPTALGALRSIPCDKLSSPEVLDAVLSRVMKQYNLGGMASSALARCEVHSACPDLIAYLGQKAYWSHLDEDGQKSLVQAVAKCGGEDSQRAIANFIEQTESGAELRTVTISNQVTPREMAIELLQGTGNGYVLKILKDALKDSFYRVRVAAVKSLGRLGLACEAWSELQHLKTSDPSDTVMAETIAVTDQDKGRCGK